MLELELVATFHRIQLSEAGTIDDSHIAYVSERVFKVLCGSGNCADAVRVLIQNQKTGCKVVCTIHKLSVEDADSLSKTHNNPFVIVSPALFASLNESKKVLVTVLRNSPNSIETVCFSEMHGWRGEHSETVQGIAVETYLGTPRFLHVGELIAVPVWDKASRHRYNELSEFSAKASDWIGPGRSCDTTSDYITYRVTSITGTDGTGVLTYGKTSENTKVFLSGQSRSISKIPGMGRYMFGDPDQSDHQLTSWIQSSESRSAVLISEDHEDFESVIRDTRYFPYIVKCCMHSEDLIGAIDSILSGKTHPNHILLVLVGIEYCNINIVNYLRNFLSQKKFAKLLILAKTYTAIIDRGMEYLLETILEHHEQGALDGPRFLGYKHALNGGDFPEIPSLLDKLKSRSNRVISGLEDVSKSPNVHWDNIGGLEEAKQELRDLLQSKLRRGILLFGPPGTGKTLLAKAVATELSNDCQFISVKGPEVLSMYIGESEKNIREIFFRAKSKTPSVVFFDELDSIAPSRGRASDSANVMDRVVSSLLTEIDNLPESVLIIGATNRPDLLDSSLLRPGRIDRQVFVGIPQDKSHIVNAVMKQYSMRDGGTVAAIAATIPRTMTGSDIATIFRKAYLNEAKRIAKKIEQISAGMGGPKKLIAAITRFRRNCEFTEECVHDGEFFEIDECMHLCKKCGNFLSTPTLKVKDIDGELLSVNLSLESVLNAIPLVTPSVSESELIEYEKLRDRRATVIVE